MPYFVYSTLATDMAYAAFTKGGGDLPVPIEPVLVKGGAGVATRNLITPRGVMTRITDAEYARMVDDPIFQLHKANGFVTIETAQGDAEAVAANLSAADPSRPLEPGDIELDPDAPKATATGPGRKARGKD